MAAGGDDAKGAAVPRIDREIRHEGEEHHGKPLRPGVRAVSPVFLLFPPRVHAPGILGESLG